MLSPNTAPHQPMSNVTKSVTSADVINGYTITHC